MTQVYEDNASRWEQKADGSFRVLPKQKAARQGVPAHTHTTVETGTWTYDNSLTPPPKTGWVITNANDFESTTLVTLHKNTASGVDVSRWLRQLDANDLITFQDASNAANAGRFLVTAPAVEVGNYFEVPVNPLQSTGTGVAKNQDVLVRFTYDEGGGGAGLTVQEVRSLIAETLRIPSATLTRDTNQIITRGTGDQRIDFDAATVENGMAWNGTDQVSVPSDGLYQVSAILTMPWRSSQNITGGNGHFSLRFETPSGFPLIEAWGSVNGASEAHSFGFFVPAQVLRLSAGDWLGVYIEPMSATGHQIELRRAALTVVKVGN